MCRVALMAGLALATIMPAIAADPPEGLLSILQKKADLGLAKYPIGFWSYTNLNEHGQYMDEDEVQEWADAGFTVTMSPTFDPSKPEQVEHMRRLLDWAQARGMKLIVEDPRTFGPTGADVPPDQSDRIAAALRDLGDHPAAFGFHIGDEPQALNGDAYFETYRMTKQAAPHLHPFMNLLPWFPGAPGVVGYETWAEYLDAAAQEADVDFLCYDCYGQMVERNPAIGQYYRNLHEYREAGWRNGVPFWTTVLSVGHFRYRCPNYDELRWQFNTAVASGASGIQWFFYYMRQPHANYRLSPVDEHWDRTQTYYDLRRIHLSFHRMYGDLFNRLAPTGVYSMPVAPDGESPVFAPDLLLSEVRPDIEDHPLCIGEFCDAEGRRYVMVVNDDMESSVHLSLTFPGADVRVFSWDWSGNEREGGAYCADASERTDAGLRIGHWLAPGQEAVYRVDSAAIRETPIEMPGSD